MYLNIAEEDHISIPSLPVFSTGGEGWGEEGIFSIIYLKKIYLLSKKIYLLSLTLSSTVWRRGDKEWIF
ncbi:MAG: hypothetical protein A3F43_06445 [Gammaproteobacteria bacterium RIFCSPHIGHO2_12_FULL_42_10]|nr:MAG: hypothetical protein A3F43_06445 [Gammaproteobacteria bacterium RIFCSPHIGHO2_12_FULL_42_10]